MSTPFYHTADDLAAISEHSTISLEHALDEFGLLIRRFRFPASAETAFVPATTSYEIGLRIGGGGLIDRALDGIWERGEAEPGVFNLNPSRVAQAWRTAADIDELVLYLRPDIIARAAAEAGYDPGKVELIPRFLARDPLLGAVVPALAEALAEPDPADRAYAEAAAQFVAAHLIRHHAVQPVRRSPPKGGLSLRARRRVEAYARAHLGQPISLADLAEAAGLSPHYFSRAYKRTTGEAPFEMVRRLRMAAAARLLADPAYDHWSVAAVAADVGYASPSRFAQAFRQYAGLSPAAYRRSMR